MQPYFFYDMPDSSSSQIFMNKSESIKIYAISARLIMLSVSLYTH